MKSFRRKTPLLWGILIGLCYYFGQPYVTLAHAELVSANPAPGAVLTAVPEQIELVFNEPISPASTFAVYDKAFGTIPISVKTDASQPDVLIGNQIEISESGVYTVQWVVISDDGHPIDGTFSFAVDLDGTGDKTMELIAAAEGTAVNLPGWFAWIMVGLAVVVPFLVLNLTKKQ